MSKNIEEIITEKLKVISMATMADSNPYTSREHIEYPGLIELGKPALPILLLRLRHGLKAEDFFQSNLGELYSIQDYPHKNIFVRMYRSVLAFFLKKINSDLTKRFFYECSVFCCFCALTDISKEHPEIPEEDRGKVTKIAEAWFKWGAEKGLCESPE